MVKNRLCSAVATAFVLASGASNVLAQEIEREPNDSVSSAQRLIFGSSGKIEVQGIIGTNVEGAAAVLDVDFYSFHGKEGDVVTFDIDDGIKTVGRSLDSKMAVFTPTNAFLVDQVDDLPANRPGSIDEGSIARFDARIDNVRLPVTGIYTVGVTNTGRTFLNGGGVTSFLPAKNANGSYKLIISGVSPSVQQISIDIKPGAGSIAPLNLKSKGKVPVALLSSKDFDATKADRDSIRFGPVDEPGTPGNCGKEGEDVNGDSRPDLVCHFEMQAANFEQDDERGMVTGTIGGMPFEGRGWLKIVPVKKHD